MNLELVSGIVAVPLIIGVVQLLKGLGLPAKYAGIVATLLGVVASVAYHYAGDTLAFEAVVVGLGVGLSAAGLYSATKNAVE